MSLSLTSRGLLHKAKHALESGPARSTAISVVSGGVGLVAGKREDAKKVPIAAIAVGLLAKVGRFHTIGDGLMAGGGTILGYKFGAKLARKEAQKNLPAMPSPQARPSAPVASRAPHPQHARRR